MVHKVTIYTNKMKCNQREQSNSGKIIMNILKDVMNKFFNKDTGQKNAATQKENLYIQTYWM